MPGSVHAGQHHSRPDLYTGSRQRFTGVGTIAAGFVALVLVLGALLTSELGRYTDADKPSDSQATGAAPPPALTPGPPAAPAPPVVSEDPGAPGGTADPAFPSDGPTPAKSAGRAGSGTKSVPPAGDATNQAVLRTVNRSLTTLGCGRVSYSATLQKAADAHVAAMIRTGYLTLVAPDGSDPGTRARAAGYRRNVLEAVVIGAATPGEAASIGFPAPGAATTDRPATIRTQSTGTLKCGYRSVGAAMRRDSRNVPITALFLGK